MTRTDRYAASLLAVSVLALGGCGGESTPSTATGPAAPSAAPSSTAPASSSASVTPTASSASPPAATPASSSAAAAAAPAGTPGPLLVLEPDGLGVLVGTSIRHLPFGSPVGDIANVLNKTIGTANRTTQPACGQGPRVQLDRKGFTALFDGSSLVGWVDSGRTSPHVTDAAGIGVGSTLASVKSVYAGVTVTEGTLGPEWSTSAGGLGGLLDGNTPASKVTTIYAGETCFFR